MLQIFRNAFQRLSFICIIRALEQIWAQKLSVNYGNSVTLRTMSKRGFFFIIMLMGTVLITVAQSIKTGADQLPEIIDSFKGKKLAVVVNHTSYSGEEHIVDWFIKNNLNLKVIFSPEHGFKGSADAGEKVSDGKYGKQQIPIYSLYGKTKKPTPEYLKDVDLVIFDIQDVGARFYTYISTMHYVMEACAENNVKFMVLDRPNPMGMFVDGPVLDISKKSFVGMHQIPVIHGLTVGELACIINQEGWLKNNVKCDLEVVECKNYTHAMSYDLPIKPSPNLPDATSIRLYPSLCLFEGTIVSIGRGTYTPFQMIGYPDFHKKDGYEFTPKSINGMSKYPKFENKKCYGYKMTKNSLSKPFDISYLIEFYQSYKGEKSFFKTDFFDKLSGSSTLRKQIQSNTSEAEIRASWQPRLNQYKALRKKYLLYPDFE